MMKRNLLTFLTLVFFSNLIAQELAPDRLTAEKLWQLGRVALFDVSPDGQTVLYGVSYYDIPENKGNRDLYAIRMDGGDSGKVKQLTNFPGNENDARYRPDGQKIGFLYKGKLWEMNPDGSDAKQVSEQDMNGFTTHRMVKNWCSSTTSSTIKRRRTCIPTCKRPTPASLKRSESVSA